jgi:hypothetical protein
VWLSPADWMAAREVTIEEWRQAFRRARWRSRSTNWRALSLFGSETESAKRTKVCFIFDQHSQGPKSAVLNRNAHLSVPSSKTGIFRQPLCEAALNHQAKAIDPVLRPVNPQPTPNFNATIGRHDRASASCHAPAL